MHSFHLRERLLLLLTSVGLLVLIVAISSGLAKPTAIWLLLPLVPIFLVIANWAVRPMDALHRLAERMQQGDLKARIDPHSDSYQGAIVAAFVSLAEQLHRVNTTFDQELSERTEALRRKADQLRALGQVGHQIAAVLEPDLLLHFVVRITRGTFDYDAAAILQRYGDHLILRACAARGVEEVPLGRVFPINGPMAPPCAQVLAGGLPGAGLPIDLVPALALRAELAIPIRIGSRTLGLFLVQRRMPESFDEEDHFTIETMASQVAAALENARLLEAERQLRELAVTDERNRMAREIHDTLAQAFMGITIQLRAMQGASDSTAASLYVQEAEALAREGLQEARRSVRNLRPHSLVGRGLADALAQQVEAVRRRGGLPVELRVEGSPGPVEAKVETALLRIGQEALHNAVKYAGAASVGVRLVQQPNLVLLSIEDDGIGFDPAAVVARTEHPTGSGLGLQLMRERAELVGGTLQIDAAPGEGCRVLVSVPLATKEHQQKEVALHGDSSIGGG
jgi:two-component system nitrate/nitrite sensor histidine kinase NarX